MSQGQAAKLPRSQGQCGVVAKKDQEVFVICLRSRYRATEGTGSTRGEMR